MYLDPRIRGPDGRGAQIHQAGCRGAHQHHLAIE